MEKLLSYGSSSNFPTESDSVSDCVQDMSTKKDDELMPDDKGMTQFKVLFALFLLC